MAAEEQLELRPSKQRWTLILLGSIGGAAVGMWMIRTGGPVRSAPFGDATFWGWVCVVFCGLGVLVSLTELFTTRGNLLLTPEGFIMGLVARRPVRWSDVGDFRAETNTYRGLSIGKSVMFDFRGRRTGWRAMFGGRLPDTYGMKAEDLARLMNEWRSRNAYRST
jgi:hypothetical protein